jgi:hypothetical protein
MTIETKYNLGNRVRIKELNRDGTVLGFCIDADGLTYRTRYFDGGKPEIVYFLDKELEPAPLFSPTIGLAVTK